MPFMSFPDLDSHHDLKMNYVLVSIHVLKVLGLLIDQKATANIAFTFWETNSMFGYSSKGS